MRIAVIALALAACGGSSADNEIRASVTLVANQEGASAQAASERLQRYGARAIPTIEAALHTASVPGRKNLIEALRRIGDPEAIPLLRHFAAYDTAPDVRREAEWTLRQWAIGSGERAERARAAVRALEELRGAEEHT